MRQSDHEYEERSFGDIQRAIDFENSMNDLESQLYYQHLSPKEVAQQVLKATCQFYDKFSQVAGNVPVTNNDPNRRYTVINGYPVVLNFAKEPNPGVFERVRDILLATSYTKKTS